MSGLHGRQNREVFEFLKIRERDDLRVLNPEPLVVRSAERGAVAIEHGTVSAVPYGVRAHLETVCGRLASNLRDLISGGHQQSGIAGIVRVRLTQRRAP